MPIFRYFAVVGTILLALVMTADRYFALPRVAGAAAAEEHIDRSVLRIQSDRKWPERIVFDTSVAAAVPPKAIVAPSTPGAAVKADPGKADPRAAFAAMQPAAAEAPPHAAASHIRADRPVRRRVARQPPPNAVASLQPGTQRGPWSW